MMRHEVLALEEQKYAGIKTTIPFKEIERIDFVRLHKDVHDANISHVDHRERFMAMDADFTQDSFSYTPLVPVLSYDGNEAYAHFTRRRGAYCAFEVRARDLSPAWFKRAFEHARENHIRLEDTGYDLELYDQDYLGMIGSLDAGAERVLRILLKIQS
jgi:hypothetical protein